jgi:hypothetical protein
VLFYGKRQGANESWRFAVQRQWIDLALTFIYLLILNFLFHPVTPFIPFMLFPGRIPITLLATFRGFFTEFSYQAIQ